MLISDPTQLLQMMLGAMMQQGRAGADWMSDAQRNIQSGQALQQHQRPDMPGLAMPPMGAAGAAGAVPPPPGGLPPIGTGRPMPGPMMAPAGPPAGPPAGGIPVPYPKPQPPAAADGQQAGPLDKFMEALGAVQPGESDMRPTPPPSAPSQPRGEHAGKMLELLMRMGVIPQTGQQPAQLSQLMRR